MTFEVSDFCAIFLDLCIYKGDRWSTDRRLDSRCYQKPMDRYLYTPFSSEHPKHCHKGIVLGELRRYIKRNTNRADYISIAALLRQRLASRGFSEKSLATAYKSAPRYEDKQKFLSQT
eukprot:SAG31_NODE_63_length_28659_cov_23.074685_10_plen_118_part_00